MTQAQADILLTVLFRAITSPLDNKEQRAMAISRVAMIVCDAGHEWLKDDAVVDAAHDTIKLHDAYRRIKSTYALDRPTQAQIREAQS